MKALLVIDVQKGYIERYDAGLLERINTRIRRAAQKGELVIYVRNVSKLKSGIRVNPLAEGLLVCSPNIVNKEAASIFSSAAFLLMLEQNDITDIDIIGIDGCCCVARSAEDARARGYAVRLECESIGAKNAERFEKKKQLLSAKGVEVV